MFFCCSKIGEIMKNYSVLLLALLVLLFVSCSDDSSSPSDDVNDTYTLKGTVSLAAGVEKTDAANVYCVWKSPMSGMYIQGKSAIDWNKMSFSIKLETPLEDDCFFMDDLAFCYIMVFPTPGYAGDINESIAEDNALGKADANVAFIGDTDNPLVVRDLPDAKKGFLLVKVVDNGNGNYSFVTDNSDVNIEITK